MPICESIRWPMRVRNVRYGSCNGSPMIRVKPREHLDEEQREDRLRTRCDVGDDGFSYHDSSLSLMMGCVKKKPHICWLSEEADLHHFSAQPWPIFVDKGLH